MKLIHFLIAAAACTVCFSVSAQWQWLDKDGRKVFSDRAPPADIPEKNILKQPNARPRVSDAPVAAESALSGAATPKISGMDKELMEKKKQAADAEAAKRKAEEVRVAKAKADNCARARQAKSGLDAGLRVSRTNAKGEREFLEGDARSQEAQRLQGIIDSDCN